MNNEGKTAESVFNRLCYYCDRVKELEFLKKRVSSCKIFKLDDVTNYTANGLNSFDEFFLPFPTVCIMHEGNPNITILQDSYKDQMGMGEREFITFYYDVFVDEGPLKGKECAFIFIGTVTEHNPKYRMIITHLKQAITIKGLKVISTHDTDGLGNIFTQQELEFFKEFMNSPIVRSVQFFATLNGDNKKFILEERSISQYKSDGKKIARSDERPKFTILNPDVIRTTMGITKPEGTGSAKCPHERRRHPRILKSDFFKNKKGDKIIIPATWIGDKESIIGNKKYIVRTDL